MKFSVLGSGSGGNSAVVEFNQTRILIDAGLSAKQLSLRLNHLGINPHSLSAILLTHEHGDHVKGLKVFVKQFPIPVYATPATSKVVRELGISHPAWKTFEASQSFQIDDIHVRSFAVHHDAVDPVGFQFSNHSHKLGFLTDAGFVTRSMIDSLKSLNALYVEANYDTKLLDADLKRPWSIKQRISSRHGHLSNDQVTELLSEIAHPDLKQVVIGHLSSDCNQPTIALNLIQKHLESIGLNQTSVHCSLQDDPTPWFSLS